MTNEMVQMEIDYCHAVALLQEKQEIFNKKYAEAYYAGAELEPVSDRHLREIIPAAIQVSILTVARNLLQLEE